MRTFSSGRRKSTIISRKKTCISNHQFHCSVRLSHQTNNYNIKKLYLCIQNLYSGPPRSMRLLVLIRPEPSANFQSSEPLSLCDFPSLTRPPRPTCLTRPPLSTRLLQSGPNHRLTFCFLSFCLKSVHFSNQSVDFNPSDPSDRSDSSDPSDNFF